MPTDEVLETSDVPVPVRAIILLSSMMTVMAGAIVAPALPEIQKHFADHASSQLLTRLIITTPALAIAIIAPLSGFLVDLFGRKRLLISSLILYAIAGTSGVWLESLETILVGRLVLGVAIAMSGLGHSAADDTYPLLSRAADSVHVLSVGAWIGGLLLLAATRPASADDAGWQAFSSVATVAAPLTVVTGLLSSWRRLMLPPLDAGATHAADTELVSTTNITGNITGNITTIATSIITSDYGRLLLAKVVLVSIMLGLGMMHRRRVLRERAPSGGTLWAELVLALAVLMVTGVLTGTSPPGE